MQLPEAFLNEHIQKLTGCSILYFKDTTHDEGVFPHYHFIIAPSDPADFVICLITSKIEKRETYYGRVNQKAAESLVKVDSSILPFLTKPSLSKLRAVQFVADGMVRNFHDPVGRKHGLRSRRKIDRVPA